MSAPDDVSCLGNGVNPLGEACTGGADSGRGGGGAHGLDSSAGVRLNTECPGHALWDWATWMRLASTASRMTHSMDRCAVFVDAGYLYAEGGKLSGIGPSRRDVRLDALRANEFLVGLATTACRLPVLRTYWYDGARDRIPTAEHQAISDLPNVKLRLGRLNQRHQQKGVDALIYHDLMTLARERAVSAAYLLSGDEDLREGVRAAQEIGVRVTLVGIRTPSGARNQSRGLASAVSTNVGGCGASTI